MGKDVPDWNDIPFDENASPEVKADEFDRQFEENRENGEAKQ
jgi:hypothetical protein